MEKFKYKFTPLVICLFILGYILAFGCIAVNIIKFINTVDGTSYNVITLIVTLAVSVAYIFLATAMLFSSYYEINEKNLVLRWGVLKNEIELKTITRLVKFAKSNKLVIYYNEDNYYVIFINPDIYDDFSKSLSRSVPNLLIDIQTDEKEN